MKTQYTLEDVLEEVCRRDFAEYVNPPKHHFSRRHRQNMKKILAPKREFIASTKAKLSPKKVAIIALLVFLAILTGAIIILRLPGFTGTVYPDHTQMFANDPTAPTIIEDVYYIADLPNNYVLTEKYGNIGDKFIRYSYTDPSTGDSLVFEQYAKSRFHSHFNNENAEIIHMKVNDYDGFIWRSINPEDQYKEIVWDNGEYIILIWCNLNENLICDLAKSTKVLQNLDQ